jgi:hypothetical protein
VSAVSSTSSGFYAGLPPVTDIAGITDLTMYRPLPDDWIVATSDIIASTEAVAAGRYKVVNTVGASVISAVANRLGHREFPFVFGGDGATLAVPGRHEPEVRDELAAVCTWASEELQIGLRAATHSIAEVRAAGHDVGVARFQIAPDVAYAMFTGGGLSYAESAMKQGAGLVSPAPAGSRPELTGLSCRWQPVETRQGTILSLLVAPRPATPETAFMELARKVLDLADSDGLSHNPLPDAGPRLTWPPRGLGLEVTATARGAARIPAALRILGSQAIGWFCDRTGWTAGGFDAHRYRREVAGNCDFRKLDDGLKMTLDVTPQLADEIEALLGKAEDSGICLFGTHRQQQALITCIVPSYVTSDHIHFIDGASGGYVAASRQLKSKISQAADR